MESKPSIQEWDTYKFHCSGLPQLMTQAKAKDEVLGETAKSYLRELWIKERFGRQKFDNTNKYTIKGVQVESDSLELVSEVLGEKIFKNNKLFENDYICGTPDICTPVLDVKSSWDIWSFFKVDEKQARSDYYWQLSGYMELCGADQSRLVYALVDTPVELAERDMYKLSFDLQEDQIKQAAINYAYEDIPKYIRVKVFHFLKNEEDNQKIIDQVIAARRYLGELDVINKLIV